MDTWDKFGFSHSGEFVREPKNDDYVPYVRYEDMVNCVKNMPTADVVEVVRCKDCRHNYYDGNQLICQKLYWYDGTNFEPSAEDFCSRGERREDG